LLPGLLLMFGLGIGYNGFAVSALADELELGRKSLQVLEPGALQAFAQSRMQPEESLELDIPTFVAGKTYTQVDRNSIVALFADGSLRQKIEQKLDSDRAQLEGRLRAFNFVDRLIWREEIERAQKLMEPTALPLDDFGPADLLSLATHAAHLGDFTLAMITAGAVVFIALFPLAWMAWPIVFREPFSYRLMGLSLVTRDGRPATRLHCTWRTLLVWGPISTLLIFSPALQAMFPEASWLSAWTAWLALGLLLGYLALALIWPARSLHDVLSGTYLVPR
jgi:hypothetical protein